jgi:2'-hydroxyisoflavone reductase
MPISRRTLLAAGLAGAAAAGLPLGRARGGDSLHILVLGGTGFLGPAFVEAARAQGHRLTLFNRGRTNPGLFPDLEQLRGDRDGQLEALEGRRFDAVVDTSGYVPRHVRLSAGLLAPSVAQYLFVSTVSVYRDFETPGMDETYPVGRLEDPTVETVDNETYGPLKALCEEAAEAAMPGRVTVVRPGLIVGPRDRTDRFTYWPARIDRGGEVLAPEGPDTPVQFIDVRDLAAFMVHTLETRTAGVFNADSPPGERTLGATLEACRRTATRPAELVWVPADFLAAHEVRPWSELPVWIPAEGEYAGFARWSTAKATAAGLVHRPVEETVSDTLAWFRTLPAERRQALRAGLDPAREAALLAAWRARSAG